MNKNGNKSLKYYKIKKHTNNQTNKKNKIKMNDKSSK